MFALDSLLRLQCDFHRASCDLALAAPEHQVPFLADMEVSRPVVTHRPVVSAEDLAEDLAEDRHHDHHDHHDQHEYEHEAPVKQQGRPGLESD